MQNTGQSGNGMAPSECASRRRMNYQASALMVIFCLVLGAQQVAIKMVADDIPPLAQVALRSSMAALLVAALVFRQGIRVSEMRSHLGPGILVGLGFAAEFLFVAWGLNYTLASHMSVFLYTAPIFAAVGLHLWVPGEQLMRRQWIGVAFAFGGMVLAMAPDTDIDNAGDILRGDLLGLLAGIAWAATTLVIRRSSLSETPPVQTLCYQLAIAGLLLLPASALLVDFDHMQFSGRAIISLTFQTLVISFAALLLWFALLRRYLASQLGIFSFLSPIFGVLFGALLLGEPLTINFLIGGIVLLIGLVVVTL
ncbi:Permease of the drug/metabolite transporter (DMT) superfamily [Kushneria avicenniae]|uniref:Permease of the drug/metabolite transporter (DMT) superfamily n=1 Tax=Kushneria avicenniae TaxID=402385 RepID=A0A1I1MUN4_9GAMM|nr:DMT family transporter [Kushneria avicenniae]SFC88632.1 Permease of the drug/metabolite transporter (DMT) superfamily [Kushneria avicenniae]